ncbi:MAG: hypothetical protein B7Z55_18895, partial [Planctomycetales bacterium 12-60-4]
MFLRLGQLIARRWLTILLVWCVALLVAAFIAPPLDQVVQTGEFAFLPESSPSRQAERLFAQAFPNQAQASTIAVIARRPGVPLTQADFDFVDDGSEDTIPAADTSQTPAQPPNLSRHLRAIAREFHIVEHSRDSDTADDSEKIPIVTHRDRHVGEMLISHDE